MSIRRAVVVLPVLVGLSAGGCTATGDGDESARRGGTLYYLSAGTSESMDPQRVHSSEQVGAWGRLWSRSLVQLPVTGDKTKADKLEPDLATDTGRMTDGGQTWTFTLRDDVTWQDGRTITCQDLKYGVSRSFATDVITGGPRYAVSSLDLPQENGRPRYDGPYENHHAQDFDKAVSCSGRTITYRFNRAFPDFPMALAQTRAFDPVRRDHDRGAQGNLDVFSNGPYRLEGTWQAGRGGTFVRNTAYDPKTDDVRKALPDRIVFQEGLRAPDIARRLLASKGADAMAVTGTTFPAFYASQLTGANEKRTTNELSPFVDYLAPETRSGPLSNATVRQALLAATDREAWRRAGGGAAAYEAAQSIIPATMKNAYAPNPSFTGSQAGDVERAKKLLSQAKQTHPAITFTYPSDGATSDAQARALAAGWQKAGFTVRLHPLAGDYYTAIRQSDAPGDVFWARWAPDWSAASTVLPPLFDSRVNLTGDTKGADYGSYQSTAFNALMDEASEKSTLDDVGEVYREADALLGRDVAYIPLAVPRFAWVHGTRVTQYVDNPSLSYYPDLGGIGVDLKTSSTTRTGS